MERIEGENQDKMPESQHIFTIQFSMDMRWQSEDKNGRGIIINGEVIELLQRAEFICLPGGTSFINDKFGFVFGKIKNKQLKNTLFVEIQYFDVSLMPIFEEVLIENKHKAYELSWNYVYIAMEDRLRYCRGEYRDPELRLLQSLVYHQYKQNLIIRLAIVANDFRQYSFNAVYETDEELKIATEIIKDIEEKIIPQDKSFKNFKTCNLF